MSAETPPDSAELARLVTDAQAAGHDVVRIVLVRKAKVPPSGVVRLYHRGGGPVSSADHMIVRVDSLHVAAFFRVSDLLVHLRARSYRCRAIGCCAAAKVDMLMCTEHWSMVPATLKVAVYTAKARSNFGEVQVSRAWVVVAERAICWVAVREGRIPVVESERRIAKAGEFDGIGDAPILDPYALLDAVSQP